MDLKINYEATRTAGKNVQSYAGDFKSLLNAIATYNNNLKQSWKGQDAESYTRKITEQAQVMDKLQKTIQEIGEFLVTVGNAYEKAMEENKIK